MESFVFYSLAALTLVSALMVVTLRNVFHSALFLGLSLAGVAGLYGSLGADFLFGAQILIYVSGIAVLVMFVVLLSGRASDFVLRQVNDQWGRALVLCGGFLAAAYGGMKTLQDRASSAPEPTTFELGRLFMGDLAVPFELISLVLLAALLGAVLFTVPEK
jgi:NADH:ubiquinone oxidoreductase subunit 6 (subunit J)